MRLVGADAAQGKRWCWWKQMMLCGMKRLSNQKNILVLVLLRFFLTWKIVIFDIFTQVPGQTAILAGFAAFFYADSCRRYVKSSFLSPFQDHFCFPQKSSSTSTSMFFRFLNNYCWKWSQAMYNYSLCTEGISSIEKTKNVLVFVLKLFCGKQKWSWNGLRNELLTYRRHESA